jgi:hypothetical protein
VVTRRDNEAGSELCDIKEGNAIPSSNNSSSRLEKQAADFMDTVHLSDCDIEQPSFDKE